jgi:hypothetical protein
MSFLELLSYFTPSKLIIERWQVNTAREQNRMQVEVEFRKIEAVREETERKAELERIRIEKSDEQHQRQIQLERERARCDIVRALIEYGHFPKSASKDIISFVVDDHSQQLLENVPTHPAIILHPSLSPSLNDDDAMLTPCNEENAGHPSPEH